jgi:transcriptional regulator with XRE-family HTH domain
MAMTGTSPTVRQRELGKRLRGLRNDHGMTVEEVAEKLMCSATKISRLETGARRPSLRDVRDLCTLYEVGESETANFMSLARGAREQGWWTRYEDLNLDPYIGLEQASAAITYYSMYYVPALLQTEEYARAIIKGIVPKIAPDIYEQRVEARMHRQQLLDSASRPRFRVLLDEAVLARQVAGPAVMCAQLDKMLEAQEDGKATIQILPFDAGAHAAADSNFVLLEFEEGSNLPPVIYVEGLTGSQYLERSTEIARYREAFEFLRDLALTPRDSVKRMIELRRAYRCGEKSAAAPAES